MRMLRLLLRGMKLNETDAITALRRPVNPDGGLKSFGHPIGASGLRMMYEMWLQLRGEAGDRQIKDPKVGLTHNLGGLPGNCVSLVAVVGR